MLEDWQRKESRVKVGKSEGLAGIALDKLPLDQVGCVVDI